MAMLWWGVFPYICLGSIVFGSMYRYAYHPMSWTSKSSELLERRWLRIGSMLFHWGLLFVVIGHIMGLLIPIQVYQWLGVSNTMYHTNAELFGGFFGLVTLIGMTILLLRRIFNARVRRNSSPSDFLADALLWIVIALGEAMTTIWDTVNGPYEYRTTVGPWVRSLFTLQPKIELMVHVPLLLQIHIIASFVLFGVAPFTRLIHMYSAPIIYITRAPMQYRSRVRYAHRPPRERS
ncbi:respiratory nitrate reductase subunit gamma [Alicyclobacillus sp. SP_1]|uniref:respiratory nitrate reductase subunit gamma n=1 Tax=Alicyclobacillus sp. SP_1 TaxID=2942475 RepID=UPI002157A5BD|nr:respiratory nitrate reductase subunit gamma [Alicyclobacillus sp. SP_1]